MRWKVAIILWRVERQGRDARIALAGERRVDAALCREHDERALGRVAHEPAVADLGVGAQGHRQQVLLERHVRLPSGVGDLAHGRVAIAGDRVAAPDDAIWTAVIWLSVSVPVLSELIAEVEPKVSTERSRFTIAPVAASFWVPMAIAVTTAGRPVGWPRPRRRWPQERSSSSMPRYRPSKVEMASAMPAMTTSVRGVTVSGYSRRWPGACADVADLVAMPVVTEDVPRGSPGSS
jgi:hypothetical protein